MIRRPRVKVARYEWRKRDAPFHDWPDAKVAVLECGHVRDVQSESKNGLVVCFECPGAHEVGKRAGQLS